MTKAQAGRLGGLKTARRGRAYMSEIGRRGARKFWELYRLAPINLSNFAIVRKTDNTIVGYTNPHDWRL